MKFIKEHLIAIIFLTSLTIILINYNDSNENEGNKGSGVEGSRGGSRGGSTSGQNEGEKFLKKATEIKRKTKEENKRKTQESNRNKTQESKFVTENTSNGKYEGFYKNGKRNGKGKYTWNSGEVYDGDWVDGNRTGIGTYTWQDGDKYEGGFKNGVRIGKGTFTWADDGTKYIGDWKNNERIGRGKYIYSNGSFSVGKWDTKNKKLIEDVYKIQIRRSNKQLNAPLENDKNLRYKVYVNGNYKTVIYKYGFNNNRNYINASPGDLIFLERNALKRERWYNKCTSFRVQENKYNYTITCN